MQHMKYTIETHNTKLSIYIVPFYGLDEINNAVLPFLKKILVYNVVGLSYTVFRLSIWTYTAPFGLLFKTNFDVFFETSLQNQC